MYNVTYDLIVSPQPRRMSFGGFGSLRKKRHEDTEEYVCPMNVEMPQSSSFQRGVGIYEENLDHLEQVEGRARGSELSLF